MKAHTNEAGVLGAALFDDFPNLCDNPRYSKEFKTDKAASVRVQTPFQETLPQTSSCEISPSRAPIFVNHIISFPCLLYRPIALSSQSDGPLPLGRHGFVANSSLLAFSACIARVGPNQSEYAIPAPCTSVRRPGTARVSPLQVRRPGIRLP